MALSSGLEPFRFERLRSTIRASLFLILGWTMWLVFFTTIPLPARIALHGTAFVILIGSFWWTLTEGAFYLLFVSLIFSSLSLTPSGFFWAAIFIVFSICRFSLTRFTLTTRLQICLVTFVISLLIEVTQIFLMNRIMGLQIFSFRLISAVFYSAILQAVMAILFTRPILALIGSK
jgi:hypothetical protein